MKKLFSVLILTLAINFLAVAGGVGWLWQSAHLDKAKIVQVKNLLFPPPSTMPSTQPTESVSKPTSRSRLDELLARERGKTAAEQVDSMRVAFDSQALELDLHERELLSLKQQVDLANQKLATDRAALDEREKAIAAREQMAQRLESDQGFQDSLALYNSMPPKQVKGIFMNLSETTVQRYIQAMEPRSATKIIKEFKTPDESAFIQRVLERMRQAQTTAPEAQASTTDGKPQ